MSLRTDEALRSLVRPLLKAKVQYDRMFGVLQFTDIPAELGDLSTWTKRLRAALALSPAPSPAAPAREDEP